MQMERQVTFTLRYKNERAVTTYLLKAIETIQENKEIVPIFNSLLLDADLYVHSTNVAKLAVQIGIKLDLKPDQLLSLAVGGVLHDIGKLHIKRSILYKETKLTAEEIAIIKKHPQMGYDQLKNTNLSPEILTMILEHHETVSGTGYPTGKIQTDLYAQIISISDIASALTEVRCYHTAMNVTDTLDYMKDFNSINQDIAKVLSSIVTD